MLPTSETAPRGYVGPIRLTEAQKVQRDHANARWIQTLIAQARDDSDPETQGNAHALLRNRGIAF